MVVAFTSKRPHSAFLKEVDQISEASKTDRAKLARIAYQKDAIVSCVVQLTALGIPGVEESRIGKESGLSPSRLRAALSFLVKYMIPIYRHDMAGRVWVYVAKFDRHRGAWSADKTTTECKRIAALFSACGADAIRDFVRDTFRHTQIHGDFRHMSEVADAMREQELSKRHEEMEGRYEILRHLGLGFIRFVIESVEDRKTVLNQYPELITEAFNRSCEDKALFLKNNIATLVECLGVGLTRSFYSGLGLVDEKLDVALTNLSSALRQCRENLK